MKHPRKLRLSAALAALLALPGALPAETGEVTLSGSTWTGKIDGVTVYTGSNYADATAAVLNGIDNSSPGTVNLRASGTFDKEVRVRSYVHINGNGNTITSNAQAGVLRGKNHYGASVSNLTIAGAPWYGMYYSTCYESQTFSGVHGSGGILMRIDNGAGGPGVNFNGGSPNCSLSGSHGVETMGINTAVLGTVTAVDRTGGCGLLFNTTTGGVVTNVNATRCTPTGGYAAYRLANSNNGTQATGTIVSNDCGRGFFSLSGSQNGAVNRVEIDGSNDVGVWIQDTPNTTVESGWVTNTPDCKWVSGSGSYANITCGSTEPPPPPSGAMPTFVGAGAVASGTGAISPGLPAGLQTGDVLLVFVETARQNASVSNQNGGAWELVTGSQTGVGSAGGSDGVQIVAYWSRYNGTQGAPTISDSGNHQLARVVAVRGAVASGDPWDVVASASENYVDTGASIPGATTTFANCLVVLASAGSGPDSNSTTNVSGWTNASLANLAERTDDTTNAGNGGSLAIATGEKSAAGAYATTSATHASTAKKSTLSIAIRN